MRRLGITQRIVIGVGVALLMMSLLFPCWQQVITYQGTQLVRDYYHYEFLFNPPKTNVTIDYQRLLLQVLVLITAMIGVVVVTPRKNKLSMSERLDLKFDTGRDPKQKIDSEPVPKTKHEATPDVKVEGRGRNLLGHIAVGIAMFYLLMLTGGELMYWVIEGHELEYSLGFSCLSWLTELYYRRKYTQPHNGRFPRDVFLSVIIGFLLTAFSSLVFPSGLVALIAKYKILAFILFSLSVWTVVAGLRQWLIESTVVKKAPKI